jgi:hypothetical protein
MITSWSPVGMDVYLDMWDLERHQDLSISGGLFRVF